jgi:hypothetical protein
MQFTLTQAIQVHEIARILSSEQDSNTLKKTKMYCCLSDYRYISLLINRLFSEKVSLELINILKQINERVTFSVVVEPELELFDAIFLLVAQARLYGIDSFLTQDFNAEYELLSENIVRNEPVPRIRTHVLDKYPAPPPQVAILDLDLGLDLDYINNESNESNLWHTPPQKKVNSIEPGAPTKVATNGHFHTTSPCNLEKILYLS